MRKFFKRLIITLLLLGAIGAAIIIAFNVWMHARYASRLYASIDDLPREDQPRVAIFFGAGLTRAGEPTPALYDRVATLDYFETGCRIARKLGAPLVNIVAPWARELGKGQGYIPRYYEVSRPREDQKYRINIADNFNYDAVWRQWVDTVKALVARATASRP